MRSKATKRNTSIIVATLFFAIFGILAIIVGVADLLNPVYPWGQKLPILGHMALLVGVLSLVAAKFVMEVEAVRRISRYYFICGRLCS